jgi:hypothetical protein
MLPDTEQKFEMIPYKRAEGTKNGQLTAVTSSYVAILYISIFFFYVIKNQLKNLYPPFIVRIVFLVLGG